MPSLIWKKINKKSVLNVSFGVYTDKERLCPNSRTYVSALQYGTRLNLELYEMK